MHSEGIDGVLRNFQHPFIQTGCLFFGQFLCFLMYEITFKLLRRRQVISLYGRNVIRSGKKFAYTYGLVYYAIDFLSIGLKLH